MKYLDNIRNMISAFGEGTIPVGGKIFKLKTNEFSQPPSEKYEDIQVKIDSLIVLNKNRKSDIYCQCGYNLSRFKEYSRCKVCHLESCCCCHFISFKMNQAQLICYNCNNKSTKKIRSLSTFQKVFNETLTNYVKETKDTEILELVKLL